MKPCPFCEQGNPTVRAFRKLHSYVWAQVTCNQCGAKGPRVDGNIYMHGLTKTEAKQHAVAQWNERAK